MKQLLNLKSYLTFLSRNKVYTAINVFGLSLSLSVLAVYFRCRKASNENPILHIKDNQ
ncbi:MAG: hypothetical protein MR681_03880 [Prevotella sp.]|nr:hypothetical protein [Prevotella sp.]